MTTTSETTEVVLRDGTTALVSANFSERFPALAPDEETLELLEANLGGEQIKLGDFKRIKVPSSDFKSWMLIVRGEETAKKTIKGVIVAWKPRRAFWVTEKGDGDSDNSRPDCSSIDNKRPVADGMFHPAGENGAQNPTGLCANCPMAQFGSGKNNGTKCREQRMLFMVLEGGLLPVVVNIPRTSIKPVNTYMLDLFDNRLKFWQVETGLSLAGATSKAGQDYNTVLPKIERVLEPEEARIAKVYGDQLREVVETALRDFTTMVDTETGEGVSVGEPDA